MSNPGDTIISRLRITAESSPDSLFCVHVLNGQEEFISYGQLWRRSLSYARKYISSGKEPGDIILIIVQHSPHLYYAFVGAMMAGLIPSIMPHATSKQDPALYWAAHKTLFDRIQPRCIVASPSVAAALLAHLPEWFHIVTEIGEVEGVAVSDATLCHRQPDDIAFLQHSSGTTALKKGVMLSHAAVLGQVNTYAKVLGFNSGHRIASWLPLYHDMGLIAAFIMPLIVGASVVMLDPFQWVAKPETLLEAIQQHRTHYCWLPNFAFNHLARAARIPQHLDLSNIVAFINCSEPCRADSFRLFENRFRPYGLPANSLQVCYAMAETVFAVSQSALGSPPLIALTDAESFHASGRVEPPRAGQPQLEFLSCGAPLAETDVRVWDAETGKVLEDGEQGQIHLRAPWMFSGYFDLPDLTREKLANGWYQTGDLGFMKEGYLYITGRSDDLLIVYGRNFYAHHVEEIAHQFAGVVPGRCVTITVDSVASGTREAVLIAEVNSGVDEGDLRRQIKERVLLLLGLNLHRLKFVSAGWLVKTTSGKIARAANRDKYLREMDSRR
ncbi:AMP-binding protein [Nitrospirillum sp. BR 11164]|uniref:AMP-binding protein n=1 Tax=Nitrospirillum sp. BR 11164 TaxID=3104324 RepID=UPI002AFDE7E9|nr:AMP-binding protein [Nitrospirillum sp. BR 11164]MEA1649031.1 AMP-binding protein [Nitrospirillum sp. BR 11164]